jgi:predicted dienelactone hydrolase
MLVLSLLLACAEPDAEAPTDTATEPTLLDLDPRERGPYQVGWLTERIEFGTPDGRARSVQISIWYPTEATEGGEVKYTGSFPGPLDGLLADAPPAEPTWEDGFPVFLHSHGHQATSGSGQIIGDWLASHGWVVAAPDHEPDLFPTVFSGEDPTPPTHYLDRPNDLSATLDHLAALPEGHPLLGKLDADVAIATGHSRGAITMWALAGATFDPDLTDRYCRDCEPAAIDAFARGLGDDRFLGVMPLAGAIGRDFLGDTGEQSVDIPVFPLTGSANDVGMGPLFDTAQGVDLRWLEIAGGCHESFAAGLPCPGLDTDDGFAIVGAYALSYARQLRFGDDHPTVQGLMDGSLLLHEGDVFRQKADELGGDTDVAP